MRPLGAAPQLPQKRRDSTLVIFVTLPTCVSRLLAGTAASIGLVIGRGAAFAALGARVAFLIVLTAALFGLGALTAGLAKQFPAKF